MSDMIFETKGDFYDESERVGRSAFNRMVVDLMYSNVRFMGSPFGYPVYFFRQRDHSWIVSAGCRWFTLADGIRHWRIYANEYGYNASRRGAGMVKLIELFREHAAEYNVKISA